MCVCVCVCVCVFGTRHKAGWKDVTVSFFSLFLTEGWRISATKNGFLGGI